MSTTNPGETHVACHVITTFDGGMFALICVDDVVVLKSKTFTDQAELEQMIDAKMAQIQAEVQRRCPNASLCEVKRDMPDLKKIITQAKKELGL